MNTWMIDYNLFKESKNVIRCCKRSILSVFCAKSVIYLIYIIILIE